MADYFTQFSCALDVGSADAATRALQVLDDLRDNDDEPPNGFEVEADPRHPGTLFITDDGGQGEPEHVICFVLACAKALDLSGRWGFAWALTCSRARLDGFGGGAHLIDLGARKTLAWTDCAHWLAERLDPENDPALGVEIP